MQVTGNNTIPGKKKLSIRLSPDGLSFLMQGEGSSKVSTFREISTSETVEKLSQENGLQEFDGPIDIILETLKTVTVPAPLFEEEAVEKYLALYSLTPTELETVVISPETGETRCIMLCDKAVIRSIRDRWGDKAHFYSLLQTGFAEAGNRELWIGLGRESAALVLRNEQVEYAEILPMQCVDDLLYYLGTLKASFDLSQITIRIKGDNAESTTKEVRKFFRNTKVDKSPLFFTL